MEKLSRLSVRNIFGLFFVLMMVILAVGTQGIDTVLAAINFTQCANGKNDGTALCDWTGGNLNSNNSLYYEGDATVQRVMINSLTPGGSYSYNIDYKALEGGYHAYDFLTTYNYSETQVTQANLCTGFESIGCLSWVPDTEPFGDDPYVPNTTEVPGQVMTIWNGTITNISGPTVLSGTPFTTTDVWMRVQVTFTVPVGQTSVLLAWGAHISTQVDWGAGNSATFINGAPYHVRFDEGQDNQLMTSAIPEPGTLVIVKDAVPDDPQDFQFILRRDTLELQTFYLDDDPADSTLLNSESFELSAGIYDVSELLPTGWSQTNASCDNGNSVTAITVTGGGTVTCTFTNSKQLADITVVKDDKWYWDPVQLMYVERWVPRGGFFTYNINVSYPVSEFTFQTATNVVMTDTLDLNLSYFEEQDPVITDPYGLTPVCTEPLPGGGGTFSCTVASMDEGEYYIVSFIVQALETTPMGGLIESGECTQNPNKQGDFDVDVCNLVSVTTDTTEYDYTNNDDSEPTDIGKSTAVTLIDFTATGAKRSVVLTWVTISETDNAGFNIYRASSLKGKKVLVNDTLIAPLGDGNPWGANYEYVDAGLKANKVYYYWLEDLDIYGVATLHGPVSAKPKK